MTNFAAPCQKYLYTMGEKSWVPVTPTLSAWECDQHPNYLHRISHQRNPNHLLSVDIFSQASFQFPVTSISKHIHPQKFTI